MPYAFIGFDGLSPLLSKEMYENSTYRNWLVFFYYWALQSSPKYSIKNALNEASKSVGLEDGWLDKDNPLSQWWTHDWLGNQTGLGKMNIYGNGNIYLPT